MRSADATHSARYAVSRYVGYPSAVGEPRILVEADGLSVSVLDDLLISHWFGPVDLATFEHYARAQRSCAASQAASYGAWSLIDVTRCTRIDDDAKTMSDAHLVAMAPKVNCVAQTVLGGGFTAAAARAIMTGQHFVQRPAYPWKIFGAIDPACEWLGQYVVPSPSIMRAAAASVIGRAKP